MPNLEDFLTQLDDAIIEGRPLSNQYDVPYLRKLREDLVFAICEISRKRLDYGRVSGELMRRFVYRLGPNDSILSLNYDIIVDNALFRFGHSELVDYGFPIRYSLERDRRPEKYILHPRSLPLYKLHGSLNWLYCPNCQQLDVTVGMKGVRYIYEEDHGFMCPDCHGRYEPLIITPTLLKIYSNVLLREVWRRAEDKVSKADKVVFIGYSLPDADVQLRCMFSRAFYKNRVRSRDLQGKTSSCKICVVGSSPPNSDTHKRYIKLFGEVEYYADGLRGYMEHLSR